MFENVTQAYTLRDATLEIVIMLAVVFALGYVLRMVMDRRVREAKDGDVATKVKTVTKAEVEKKAEKKTAEAKAEQKHADKEVSAMADEVEEVESEESDFLEKAFGPSKDTKGKDAQKD